MKSLFITTMLLLSLPAIADHLDVIEFKLLQGCSFSTYMEIVSDFNEWGKKYEYRTEILVPLQAKSLVNMYWLGTSPNTASFGRAWDAWRDAQNNPSSTPAKLHARFSECKENIGRSSYDVY